MLIKNSNDKIVAFMNNLLSASSNRKINGLYKLKFETLIDYRMALFLYDNKNVVEINNDWFKVSKIVEKHESNNLITVYCEAEHISYELIDNTFLNFHNTGTLENTLIKLLSSTDYSFSTNINKSESFSCNNGNIRNALVEIAKLWNGELSYNKKHIILNDRIGTNKGLDFRWGKNVNSIKRNINFVTGDITYTVDVVEGTETEELGNYELGDTVAVIDSVLNIDKRDLRVIEIEKDLLTNINSKVVLGNVEKTISNVIVDLNNSTLKAGKIYHGITIDNKNGFYSKRSDGNAESIFNSDTLAFRQKVNGKMQNAFYFNTDKNKFVLNSNVEVLASAASVKTAADYILDECYVELDNANMQLDTTENIIKDVYTKIDITEESINTKIQDTKDNISTLEQTVNSFSTKIESVEGNVSTLEQTVNSFSTKIESVEGNVSTLEQTVNSFNTKIESVEGNVSTLEQTVNSFNTKIESVEGNVSTLEQTVNSFSTKIESVEGNVSTLEQTVNSFSTKIQNVKGDITELTQSINGFSAVVNSTKVTITEGNGITVKNGGFRILKGSTEVFGITSNGYIKQLGEFYNACGKNAVRIYNGEIEIAAQASGSIPMVGGSVVGSIGGQYTYSSQEVLKINAKENFKLTTDYDDDLFYEMKISSYNDYRGSKYHNFRGTVVFHTKPFKKVKKFKDIDDEDYVLVSEYRY